MSPHTAVRFLCVLVAVALHALLCFATFTGKRETAELPGSADYGLDSDGYGFDNAVEQGEWEAAASPESATKALRLVNIREVALAAPELKATQTALTPDAVPTLPIGFPAETVVPVAELALTDDFSVPISPFREIERSDASAEGSQNTSQTQRTARVDDRQSSADTLQNTVGTQGSARTWYGRGSSGSSRTRAYLAALRRKIQQALVYPPHAKKTRIQGTVEVVFTVRADGAASGVSVSKSSGEPLLDGAAVDAIVAASPFPPPSSPVKLAVPVVFVLE